MGRKFLSHMHRLSAPACGCLCGCLCDKSGVWWRKSHVQWFLCSAERVESRLGPTGPDRTELNTRGYGHAQLQHYTVRSCSAQSISILFCSLHFTKTLTVDSKCQYLWDWSSRNTSFHPAQVKKNKKSTNGMSLLWNFRPFFMTSGHLKY